MTAIDQMIAGGIRPVDVEPYGAAEARTMSLREMYQRGQQTKQETAIGKLKLDEAERGVRARKTLSDLLTRSTSPDGVTDHNAVVQGLTAAGFGEEGIGYKQNVIKAANEQRKAQLAQAKEQHAFISNGLMGVKNAGPEAKDATYAALRGRLLQQGLIRPEDMPEIHNPAFVDAELAQGIEADKQITAAQKAIELAETATNHRAQDTTARRGQDMTSATAAATNLTAQRGQDMTATTAAESNKTVRRGQDITAATATRGQNLTDRHNRAMETAAQDPVNLTPEAVDKMATMFATTGQLPSLGNGKEATKARQLIINRAAQQFGGVNFASSSAEYKANKDSLQAVTKQLDAVESFERTALKNLKLFTDAAAKIPDTGVPWLNTPVRLLSDKLVGSENMAAVNAARTVALTEIAKITNNPNLSGQLSDSAREEIMHLSPKDATLGQIRKVAAMITQDAANRKAELGAQKEAISQRIGGVAAGAGGAAPAAPTGSRGGHTSDLSGLSTDELFKRLAK